MRMTQHSTWHVILGRYAELLLSVVGTLRALTPQIYSCSNELGFSHELGVSPGALALRAEATVHASLEFVHSSVP